jgi:hypothetical protein
MPLRINTTKGDRQAARSEPPPSQDERAVAPAGVLDLGNRSPRSPVAWLIDGSPSVAEQHADQRTQTETALAELRRHPVAGRSVVFNLVQIVDVPVSTGFVDIARFALPPFLTGGSTPIHAALERAVDDAEALAAKLRTNGFERTEGVVVLTTDGCATRSAGSEDGEGPGCRTAWPGSFGTSPTAPGGKPTGSPSGPPAAPTSGPRPPRSPMPRRSTGPSGGRRTTSAAGRSSWWSDSGGATRPTSTPF